MRLGFWRSPPHPHKCLGDRPSDWDSGDRRSSHKFQCDRPQIGILAIAAHLTSFSAIAPPSPSQNSRWMRSPFQLRWVAGEEAIALLFQLFSLWTVRGEVVRLAIALGIKTV